MYVENVRYVYIRIRALLYSLPLSVILDHLSLPLSVSSFSLPLPFFYFTSYSVLTLSSINSTSFPCSFANSLVAAACFNPHRLLPASSEQLSKEKSAVEDRLRVAHNTAQRARERAIDAEVDM